MAAVWKWFSDGPVAPDRVPTDTIIPLYRLDDTTQFRRLAFELNMQFEEVLDAEKLAAALWKLLERPGWRKLGARLRRNDKGKLEYHVPAQYTKQRPPINLSKVEHNCSLSNHPLSEILPRSNGVLQAFDKVTPLHEYLDLNDNTRYLEDWLYTDKAQIGLHIVTFTDATFITLTWIHTLLDAMGQRALFEAWVAMLEGREDEVPEFLGYDSDPMDALGVPISSTSSEAPVIEEYVMKDKLLKGLGKVHFMFNYVWESIFHPSESWCMIAMPSSYLARLRHEAYADLATAPAEILTYSTKDPASTSEASRKPFVSDGDILTAWTSRLLTASNPSLHSTTRPLLVINALGLRSLVSTSNSGYPAIISKEKAYIHNCVTTSLSLFPRADDILTQPLGHVAARIRKDLSMQTTRAQIEAGQRLARDHPQALFGSGNMGLHIFSNWTKANFYNLDFSSAIVTEAASADTLSSNCTSSNCTSSKRGQPIYIQPDATTSGLMLRGVGNCIGIDHNGTVWILTKLQTELTANLTREIETRRTTARLQDGHGIEPREQRWVECSRRRAPGYPSALTSAL